MIINLPKNLERETTHRYGPNSFKLHRRAPPVAVMVARVLTLQGSLIQCSASHSSAAAFAAVALAVGFLAFKWVAALAIERVSPPSGSDGVLSCACRLPVPRPGQVLGLVGTNGIGKSTALKVLAGKLKPNLGRFEVRQPAAQPRVLQDLTILCSQQKCCSDLCA